MKKLIVLSVVFLFAHFTAITQTAITVKKVLELKIAEPGGANGASVAWHPIQKKYYAAQAGNADFPLTVFDAKGKVLSKSAQKTMFDTRGLWYNSNTKKLQANGYNDFGWTEYVLDGKGMPIAITPLYSGMKQPDEQSAGTYDAKKNVVYFFDNVTGNIAQYKYTDASYDKDITLHLGVNKGEESDTLISENYEVIVDYNSSTIVYTGIKGAEIGLLNHASKTIELYDLADGFIAKKFNLPEDATVESFLNFSYCNGIFWLADKSLRIWNGYK